MTDLSRHPEKSTEELRRLDGWYAKEHATIMSSETLTPAAKKGRLERLRAEYLERWIVAKQAAEQDLEEWGEIFEARAVRAQEPKAPQDREAGILRTLELQRLHGRIERSKDQPGRLLALYEQALRSGNHAVAHELEDSLPALWPEAARGDFVARVREERERRLSEADRRKLEEAEAYSPERSATELGLTR